MPGSASLISSASQPAKEPSPFQDAQALILTAAFNNSSLASVSWAGALRLSITGTEIPASTSAATTATSRFPGNDRQDTLPSTLAVIPDLLPVSPRYARTDRLQKASSPAHKPTRMIAFF